jgi:hypothetical protein
MGKLSDLQIKHWVKSGKQVSGKSDGHGLTFTLSKTGVASWVLRYRFGGKLKEKTLGRYPDISLADARRLALSERATIQTGTDVANEKQLNIRAAARAWNVHHLADDYFLKAKDRLAQSTIYSRKQQLRDYVMPRIGNLAARDVNR